MKKTYTLSVLIIIATLSLIDIASAQSIQTGIANIGGIVNDINNKIVRALITLFSSLALAAFLFGMVQFIWASRQGDATKIDNGKKFMLWSTLALFVMFSIWGIVGFLQTTFGLRQGSINISAPQGTTGTGSTNTGSSSGLPTQGSGNFTTYSGCMQVNGDHQTCYALFPNSAPSSSGTIQDYQTCMSVYNDEPACRAAFPN